MVVVIVTAVLSPNVKFANALSKKEGRETCYQIEGKTVIWSHDGEKFGES